MEGGVHGVARRRRSIGEGGWADLRDGGRTLKAARKERMHSVRKTSCTFGNGLRNNRWGEGSCCCLRRVPPRRVGHWLARRWAMCITEG